MTGFWVDSSSGVSIERRKVWLDLRFWALLISSLLGLLYLFLVPVHQQYSFGTPGCSGSSRSTAVQAEGQLEAQIKSDQIKAQVEQLKSQRILSSRFRRKTTGSCNDPSRVQMFPRYSESRASRLQNMTRKPSTTSWNSKLKHCPLKLATRFRNRKRTKRERVKNSIEKFQFADGNQQFVVSDRLITVGWTGSKSMEFAVRPTPQTSDWRWRGLRWSRHP